MFMLGKQVLFSAAALKETAERLFPVSRHRSKRTHKKLVKRFGGEFRKVPCIFTTPQAIYVHPAMKAEFLAAIDRENMRRPSRPPPMRGRGMGAEFWNNTRTTRTGEANV